MHQNGIRRDPLNNTFMDNIVFLKKQTSLRILDQDVLNINTLSTSKCTKP